MAVKNSFPISVYLFVFFVFLAAFIYALPNLYGQDPVLQIEEVSFTLDEALQEELLQTLEQANIKIKHQQEILPEDEEKEAKQLILHFYEIEDQLKAADLLRATLASEEAVVLNLKPVTPKWLAAIGGKPVNLGLDLRGGVEFLMEVDINAALTLAQERYVEEMRSFLREEKLYYSFINQSKAGINIRFKDTQALEAALPKLKHEFRNLVWKSSENAEEKAVLYANLIESAIEEERKVALQQNILTLRNRVNELGVAEPLVQQQGENRIAVQLPGVQDPRKARDILKATATLEFRLVHGSYNDWEQAVKNKTTPIGTRLYKERDGSPVLLERKIIVTGDQIIDASSGIDQESGSSAVFVTLDGRGARYMADVSSDNIGNLMAVVFIENKVDVIWVNGEKQKVKRKIEEVINVATIQDRLGSRFQITGLDSTEEARDLALLLRAGALKAPVEIVQERTFGPSLGKENIERGMIALAIGFVLILFFMLFYYKAFGIIANIALLFNLVLLMALLSLLQATLTLPGIAGIVLTLGMAVDANVLIYERIKEELRNGNSPQASIHAGYESAFATIADANITTLIAGVVLFSFGAGAIKGFAVTLSLGILTSMFTAVLGSRALVNLIFGNRRQVKKLMI